MAGGVKRHHFSAWETSTFAHLRLRIGAFRVADRGRELRSISRLPDRKQPSYLGTPVRKSWCLPGVRPWEWTGYGRYPGSAAELRSITGSSGRYRGPADDSSGRYRGSDTSSGRMGFTTCAARSAARADRRSAFQAGASSCRTGGWCCKPWAPSCGRAFPPVVSPGGSNGTPVRGAERRACRSEDRRSRPAEPSESLRRARFRGPRGPRCRPEAGAPSATPVDSLEGCP